MNKSKTTPAKEALIQWFQDRRGKVGYSQADRLGPLRYDCSSAVYFALLAAGFLPKGTVIGNTDSLYRDLPRHGWQKLTPLAGRYQVQRGDIFLWGVAGASSGHAGHTGVFLNEQDQMIHCTCGWDGQRCSVATITVDDHDTIWRASGQPPVTVFRFKGGTPPPSLAPSGPLIPYQGRFVTAISLPVSADTDPASPAVAHYPVGGVIWFDSYCAANGYLWISYLAVSGLRRYVAIGPDDGDPKTVWGSGF